MTKQRKIEHIVLPILQKIRSKDGYSQVKALIFVFMLAVFFPAYGQRLDNVCGIVGGGEDTAERMNLLAVKSVTAIDYGTLKGYLDAGEPFVFIPATVEINIPNRSASLTIRRGQVLFSDRGIKGSQGGKLLIEPNFNDSTDTYPVIEMESQSRISGLRIEGPVKVSNSIKQTIGIQLKVQSQNVQIDSNELFGWPWAAISIKHSQNAYIHNNYIHSNMKSGLGYGVVVQNGNATAEVNCNIFNANRHAIAGSGNLGECYHAHHNLVMPGGKRGAYHQFDMHAFGPAQTAGQYISITNNWFNYGDYGTSNRSAIMIRGVPKQGSAIVKDNWFHSLPQITATTNTIQGVPNSVPPAKKLVDTNKFGVKFTFTKKGEQCMMHIADNQTPVLCAGVGL